MDKLVERYIYDVTRRLSDKERGEVRRELEANIYDMLPENPNEAEIKAVLYKLGAPASLAEEYRQNPRYLISPAFYNAYIRSLKIIVPLVGSILFALGMFLGGLETAGNGTIPVLDMLLRGIFMGGEGVFQALVWTTLGFVIAERVASNLHSTPKSEWKIDDLPDEIPVEGNKIPLSDSIAELVITVLFSFFVILVCSGSLSLTVNIQNSGMQIIEAFNPEFLVSFAWGIAILALLGVCECVVKIRERRWTALACITSIISNLISIGILGYLVSRANMFSAEFIAFQQSFVQNSEVPYFLREGALNMAVTLSFSLMITIELWECCMAIYRFRKGRRT